MPDFMAASRGRLLVATLATFCALPGSIASQGTAALPEPHHLFDDVARAQVVMLASSRQSDEEELWRFDAGQWRRLDVPGTAPPARNLGAAAYDTRRGRIVLHGGVGSSGGRRGDTWEWDGATWKAVNATSIGPRDHHSMAYDEARGRMVLFGGASSGDELASDTWEYDGAGWTRVATDGPAPRAHFGMAYDARARHVVIFGGLARGTGRSHRAASDTWAWDGKAWRQLADQGPPPRTHIKMAFDRRANRLVLFGGQASGPTSSLADTWTWDGERWTQVASTGPSARSWHVTAFDSSRKMTLLHGGSAFDGKVSTTFKDTWAWNGANWTRVDRH